jgi:hypothetical protein
MDNLNRLLERIEDNSEYRLVGKLFCLQVEVELKIFRIEPIEDVYRDAFVDFVQCLSSPYVTLAISNDKNELWRFKEEVFDKKEKVFHGNIIRDERLRLIEGHPTLNLINITKVPVHCDDSARLFQYGVNRDWLLLGIATDAKIARQHALTIRVLGRPENQGSKR